jgi:hypothetical protein
LPKTGSVFIDARGGDRALRATWHHEAGVVVLSLWRDNICAGSFRLRIDEVPEFIDMLRTGLDRAYDAALVRSPGRNGGAALRDPGVTRRGQI